MVWSGRVVGARRGDFAYKNGSRKFAAARRGGFADKDQGGRGVSAGSSVGRMIGGRRIDFSHSDDDGRSLGFPSFCRRIDGLVGRRFGGASCMRNTSTFLRPDETFDASATSPTVPCTHATSNPIRLARVVEAAAGLAQNVRLIFCTRGGTVQCCQAINVARSGAE